MENQGERKKMPTPTGLPESIINDNGSAYSKIYNYLRENVDVALNYTAVAKDTGVASSTASAILMKLWQDNTIPVDKIQAGIYIYRSNGEVKRAPGSPPLYEELFRSASGRIYVKCEKGTVYYLTEAE
jgi:hypothetical protein